MKEFLQSTWKAFAGALAVVIGSLTTILVGDQGIQDVTFVQWLVIAGAVLATWGFVYSVPNKTALVSNQRTTQPTQSGPVVETEYKGDGNAVG